MTTASIVGFTTTVLALLVFVVVSILQLRRVDRVARGELSVRGPGRAPTSEVGEVADDHVPEGLGDGHDG